MHPQMHSTSAFFLILKIPQPLSQICGSAFKSAPHFRGEFNREMKPVTLLRMVNDPGLRGALNCSLIQTPLGNVLK